MRILPRVNVASRTFVDMCSLKATVSTTGYCGGDGGHGGQTEVAFQEFTGEFLNSSYSEIEDELFRIVVAGDAELRVLIQALRFSADALEMLAEPNYVPPQGDNTVHDTELPFSKK